MHKSFRLILGGSLAAGVLLGATTGAQGALNSNLTVQLKWYDQAQFAGFYIAEQQGYFARENLSVRLISGGPDADPVVSLASGAVDTAVLSQRQAELAIATGTQVVNVAQVFQANYMVILCNTREGLNSIEDLPKATFAQAGSEYISDIRQFLTAVAPTGAAPTFVEQRPDIESLTSGQADCMLGSTFNEYWRALDARLPLAVYRPEDAGIDFVQDGLYVLRNRLTSSEFRNQLAHLVIALESGWKYASANPESTVRLVLSINPDLSYEVQTRQLESVLTLIDLTESDFGYYDLAKYARVNSFGVPLMTGPLAPDLWTHSVIETADRLTSSPGLLAPSVKFYLNSMRETRWYHWLIYLGTVAAAVAGSVMGARRGYRFWGCFVLALASAIGGGVLRDIVIGGDRYPVWLTHHPTEIYLAFAGAVATEIVRRLRGSSRALAFADDVAGKADVVGFSILAIHGAAVAMCADLPAVWAPLAAALTVSGGGVLSDILVAQEHVEFRTVPYEEQALAGSLVLVAGLWIANHFEHHPVLVEATFAITLLALLTGRYAAVRDAVVQRRKSAAPIPA